MLTISFSGSPFKSLDIVIGGVLINLANLERNLRLGPNNIVIRISFAAGAYKNIDDSNSSKQTRGVFQQRTHKENAKCFLSLFKEEEFHGGRWWKDMNRSEKQQAY